MPIRKGKWSITYSVHTYIKYTKTIHCKANANGIYSYLIFICSVIIVCTSKRNFPTTKQNFKDALWVNKISPECQRTCRVWWIYKHFGGKVFASFALKTKSEEDKVQESIQLSTTSDPWHHIGKWQKHKKTSHTRKPRCQYFPNSWSQGCMERTRQHKKDKYETEITKVIHKRSTTLERSVKYTGGLKHV